MSKIDRIATRRAKAWDRWTFEKQSIPTLRRYLALWWLVAWDAAYHAELRASAG